MSDPSCNSICTRFSVSHSESKGSGYGQGLFRCGTCRVYYETHNVFISPGKRRLCPCCKTPVRSKPKWKSKQKMIISVKIK